MEYKNLGIDFSSQVVGFDGDWNHSFSSLSESFLAKYKGYDDFLYKNVALLHKDWKCKAPLIELNLRRNLGKWST